MLLVQSYVNFDELVAFAGWLSCIRRVCVQAVLRLFYSKYIIYLLKQFYTMFVFTNHSPLNFVQQISKQSYFGFSLKNKAGIQY